MNKCGKSIFILPYSLNYGATFHLRAITLKKDKDDAILVAFPF
jgi:hypothetical protein